MPVVRAYDTGQVQARPVTSAKVDGVGSTGFGLDIADAGRRASGALGQVAQDQFRLQDQMDEAAARQLDTEYEAFERATLYGTADTPGFFSLKGQDALNARAKTEEALTKFGGELSARATTGQQRAMFGDIVKGRLNRSLSNVGRYSQEEVLTYNRTSTQARVFTFGQSAAALWADPQEQAIKKAAGLAELQDLGRLEGWGADVYAMKALEFTSELHAGALASMIEVDPRAADDYLKRHAGEMTDRARGAALGPVRSAVVELNAADFSAGLAASGAAALPVAGAGNPISSQIVAQAQAQGVDPATATVFAMIESGMQPTAKNGQSHGVFQLQDDPWRQMGGTAADRDNPARQVELGVKYIKRTTDRLTKRLGRKPEAWEVYMAHQQGDAGGPALMLAPPEVSAVAVLEGIDVSPARAKASIVGNGGRADMTAGEFVAEWKRRFAIKAAKGATTAAGTAAANMSVPVEPDLPSMIRMAQVAAGGDPDQRKANVAAAKARYSELQQTKTAREQAADDALQAYIHGPNAVRSIEQIPASVRTALSPQKLGALQDHFASGGAFAKVNDVTAQTYLSDMIARNPEAFAREDLTKWAGKLTDTTYGSMLTEQRAAREGKRSEKAVVTGDIMEGASAILVRNGMDPKKDKAEIGRLQQVMLDWSDQFIAKEKRRPSSSEINQALDGYLLKGVTDDKWYSDGTTIRVYQAAGAKSFKLTVPREAEKKITADFVQSKGREPNRQELVSIYRTLHAAGKID